MTGRPLSLWTFCSVKGGVGKSTLAVVCAKLLAQSGRVPVLIDCDMAGASLADGLRICAPSLMSADQDTLALDCSPAGGFLSWEQTQEQRRRRRDRRKPVPPPFLNDALHAEEVCSEAILWRHERADGVRYLPSSSLSADVVNALEWLSARSFDWLHALSWLLDALIRQLPSLTDVVIDLPPGVWGFSHEMLVLIATLQRGELLPEGFPQWQDISWSLKPFLVMTADRGDLLPSLEYIAREVNTEGHLRELIPVVNRRLEPLDETMRVARARLGPVVGKLGVEQSLRTVDLLPALQKLFFDQDLDVDDSVRKLANVLDLPEAP